MNCTARSRWRSHDSLYAFQRPPQTLDSFLPTPRRVKITKLEDRGREKQVQVCRVASGLLRYLYLGVFLFYVTLQIIQAGPTATAQGADVIARIVGQVMILCVRHDPTAYFAFASVRVRHLFEIVRQINFLNVRKRRALSALRC